MTTRISGDRGGKEGVLRTDDIGGPVAQGVHLAIARAETAVGTNR